ncbi:hypothetical protein GCM10009789_41650 [Kribbella sancticallisti]|uniref:Uncharacterized protein n=1 Tax=Kribbella sancticallisti TaxID=460087 RepID=A0ABP4PJY0_9ACTN
MSERPEHLGVPRLFVSARIHLNRALEQRRECIRRWDEIRQQGPFSAWLEKSREDTVELWCAYRPSALQLRAIDEAAGILLSEVKSAMDAAVLSLLHLLAGAEVAREDGVTEGSAVRIGVRSEGAPPMPPRQSKVELYAGLRRDSRAVFRTGLWSVSTASVGAPFSRR